MQSSSASDGRDGEERIWLKHYVMDGVRFKLETLRVDDSDEDGDGVWVASDAFSAVYGDGRSARTAVDDYVSCLVERFLWADAHRVELGPGLLRELARLEERMERVPAQ